MPLLDIPRICGLVGRPRHRPRRLFADRGYDYDKYRRLLRARGITPKIARKGTAHGSGLGKTRWVVERTFAWLHQFKRHGSATRYAPTSTSDCSNSPAASSACDDSEPHPEIISKKKHHGMNVQVLADPAGRLIWASDALPGATHDLTAARTHDIPATLAAENIKCWADKAYQGANPTIRVPFRGRNLRGWGRRHNRDHTKIRSLGERAMAVLKGWRLLHKLRCSTTRITAIVRAVAALELAN